MPHLIHAGDIVAELTPETGGSIARFDFRGERLFRAGVGVDPRDMGCFPLVPFSNRIRDGRLPTPRGDVHLAPLPGLGPHPIHGLGWRSSWTVDDANATTLAMRHEHAADAHWPFDYLARQIVRVDEHALEIAIELTNRGPDPMPAGIGLHPYFPATPRAALTADVVDMWRADAALLPTYSGAIPAGLHFDAGQALADTQLDNCFGGWSGRAVIEWPERGIALDIQASEALRTLVVYTPPGHDFFCVEPASHLNNAFQLAAAQVSNTGARLLMPGNTLEGTVRFAPRAA